MINELPPGRKPPITKVIKSTPAKLRMYDLANQQINEGRQVFVVYPLINDSPVLALKSVMAEVKNLSETVFKQRRVIALHGQLKPAQRAKVMESFSEGKIDVLVATTMVEVGSI